MENAATTKPPLLRVEDATRTFGGITALNGVSFQIPQPQGEPRGQICGLIGPNGAGKTTMINAISGLQHLTRGRIYFENKDITYVPPHVIANLGIGRTFQNIRLFNDLSVLENVMVGHHLRQKGSLFETVLHLPRSNRQERETREVAMNLLRRLRMEHLAQVEAGGLSYGDQRRVEIARALAFEPRLLLLDEPAAGMNSAETEQLAELMLELREGGLTFLVIEHDMELIMRVSDRVVVLNFGRKIAEDVPETVRADPRVIEAYLGEEAA